MFFEHIDLYLCFVVFICIYNFNYSSLAEVIACIITLSPLKGKSTRYHCNMDLMTQTGGRYPLFNKLNNGALIKRPQVDNNDGIIITDFSKTAKKG